GPRAPHYHDAMPSAKNNFATAAKSTASTCNIERHPLRDTASLSGPLGVARLAMAYPTLRSSTFRSAPLLGSGDQGPLLSRLSLCGSPGPTLSSTADQTVNSS